MNRNNQKNVFFMFLNLLINKHQLKNTIHNFIALENGLSVLTLAFENVKKVGKSIAFLAIFHFLCHGH